MRSSEAIAFFADKKKAYQLTFGTDAGRMVLEDLEPFCRARETCVVAGQRDLTYVLEGRREVYLRIREWLDLTPEQLVQLKTTPLKGADDE